MIKVITVTYGTHGESNRYTYLTDRVLKVGQQIQPSVKHAGKKQTIYSTTAVVETYHSPNSKEGQRDMAQALGRGRDLQAAYTYKDAGITNKRDATSGKFIRVEHGDKLAFKLNEEGERVIAFAPNQLTKKEQQLRNYNTNMRMSGQSLEFQDQIKDKVAQVQGKIKAGEFSDEDSEQEDMNEDI